MQPLDAAAIRMAKHKIRDFSRMIAPSIDTLKIKRDGIIVGRQVRE
jgi:hypothetical protein